jgi:hypothetical protein
MWIKYEKLSSAIVSSSFYIPVDIIKNLEDIHLNVLRYTSVTNKGRWDHAKSSMTQK